jgi:hypothetical protein
VLVRLFPCRVYIDSSHCDTLSYEWQLLRCSHPHSMVVVFELEDGGSEDVGYGYVIWIITVFTLPLALTSVNVLLVYTCSSL